MQIVNRDDGGRYIAQQYLHGDGLPLLVGLKTATQVGMVSLEILNEVFGARFEILGVKASRLLKKP